jgi:FkbM family methyltransferase
MALRDWIHLAGRMVTRTLLHPRWRHYAPVSWVYVQLYLRGKRLTERHELSMLRSLIAPGMVIADIGANAGFYTLEMAARVGPTGRILAFEPDPFNFKLLQGRAERAAANIQVHQLALSDRRERATLFCSAYNRADNRLGHAHAEPHVERVEVEVDTLDEFLLSRGVSTIDALKIDVQGNEARVLTGAEKMLRAGVRWIWFEFSPDHLRAAGSDPERLLETMSNFGMDLFEVDQHGHFQSVTNYRDHTEKLGSRYGDIVAVRSGQALGIGDRPAPQPARA